MNQEQHAKLYPGAGQDWENEPVEVSVTPIAWENALQDQISAKMARAHDEPATAASILQAGMDALLKNAALRDKPTGERSAPKAAAILTAWTDEEWTAIDVWKCLIAVKLARESQGAVHIDDYVDSAAYLALLGEEVTERNS